MAESNNGEIEYSSGSEDENGDENIKSLPGGANQITCRKSIRSLKTPFVVSKPQRDETGGRKTDPLNFLNEKAGTNLSGTSNKWEIGILSGITVVIILLDVLLCVYLLYSYFMVQPKINGDQQEVELKQIHQNLRKMFPNDNQLWPTFLRGLNNSYFSTMKHPLIMLFLYSKDQKGTADCLASCMLKISKRFLKRDSSPVKLRGSELSVETGDYFMTWKHDIEKSHVMIITELEQMPAGIAKYLHSFCDVINPAVQQAIYLFFMEVPKSNDSPFVLAEDLMLDVWNSLEQYELRPLVTRLLENVLIMKSPPPANCSDI